MVTHCAGPSLAGSRPPDMCGSGEPASFAARRRQGGSQVRSAGPAGPNRPAGPLRPEPADQPLHAAGARCCAPGAAWLAPQDSYSQAGSWQRPGRSWQAGRSAAHSERADTAGAWQAVALSQVGSCSAAGSSLAQGMLMPPRSRHPRPRTSPDGRRLTGWSDAQAAAPALQRPASTPLAAAELPRPMRASAPGTTTGLCSPARPVPNSRRGRPA